MSLRNYLLVSGTIFALVAAVHLWRLATSWALVIGSWSAPTWVSVLGTLIPGFLAYSALRLARPS